MMDPGSGFVDIAPPLKLPKMTQLGLIYFILHSRVKPLHCAQKLSTVKGICVAAIRNFVLVRMKGKCILYESYNPQRTTDDGK